MKKLYITLMLLMATTLLVKAQDSYQVTTELFGKVSFYNGNYENFLMDGAKQTKPIMLLFCREGCHTCNHLKRGLKKSDVGEYFSRYFFSYFVDTDKEKFKLFPLSEKYNVNATPFFVFMTPEGKIIYKGTMHPEKDSVLETCTQIMTRYINYRKVADEIKLAVTPEKQTELAEQLAERFKGRFATVDARSILFNFFLTGGQKEYKVFNETFMTVAAKYQDNNSPFKVDDVASVTTGKNGSKGSCSKKSSKWQKWENEE